MKNLKAYRAITTREWLIDVTLEFCERHSGWSGIAGAFLVGLFINTWSDPNVHNLSELLNRLFNVHARSLNILSWIATTVILLLSFGRLSLAWYSRKRSYEIRLAELYRDRVDSCLRPFQRGRIAWGLSLTLQSPPDLRKGWPVEEVHIEYDITQYVFPGHIDELYKQYVESDFHKKYQDDRTRLMLTENPIVFSDLPTLRLRVRWTKWSQLRFYQDHILGKRKEQVQHIQQVLAGPINFPNSLALLLVVATSDGYVLLIQTSPKVHYYPSTWACSIGEHLDVTDLQGPEERFALNWIERALWEELGVSPNGFKPYNARIMAVIMESQIVNCSLVGVVTLNHNRSNLNAIIDKQPRTDYEFQDWDLISWDDIPRELISPTRQYHPSTGLRMFYSGLHKFGVPGLNRRLMYYRSRSGAQGF